jgi:hypothetical protein
MNATFSKGGIMEKMLHLVVVTLSIAFVGNVYGQETMPKAASSVTVEAQLCTDVQERMPVGAAESFSADVGKVCLWCKVMGATDTTFIKHVWSHQGKEMATVELPVRSSSWRTWSCKTILPEWTGEWEVKALGAKGEVLKALTFTIGAPKVEKPIEKPKPPDTTQDTGKAKKP